MAEFTLESLPTAAAPTPAGGGFVLESLPEPEKPGAVMDTLKSLGSGAMRGVASIPGMAVDAANLGTAGVDWLAEKIARKVFGDERVDAEKKRRLENPSDVENFSNWVRGIATKYASGKTFSDLAREYLPGADYDPKTTAGEYGKTVGELGGGAVVGPGRIVPNLLKYGLGAGIASEAGGQMTKGTAAEPWARAAGALLGGGGAHVLGQLTPGARTVEQQLRGALRGVSDQQISDAMRIYETAQNQGIRLTLAEAVDQAAPGYGAKLLDLQRLAESTPGGRTVMEPLLAERPGQVEAAVRGQLAEISPQPGRPDTIGAALARNATEEIEGVRRNINTASNPLYRAAEADIVPAAEMQRLQANPSYVIAERALRNDPEIGPTVANLPADSAAFVDKVKQQLNQMAENAGVAVTGNQSRQLQSVRQTAAQDAGTTSSTASQNLADALEMQRRRRAEELQPLQEGQMGQIANAGDTRAALEALLPAKPLPGLADTTRQTTAALAARDAPLTAQAIRLRLEDAFEQSAKDLQGGANAKGGANFRKTVYGSDALRENLQAAVRELPNGQQIGQGLNELMTTLEATGRRQAIGSKTAFNKEAVDAMSGGSAAGELAAGIAKPGQIAGFVKDRYRQWVLGRNMEELARFLATPANRERLAELARDPQNAAVRAQLQLALASSIVQRESEGESPQSRQGLINSMMPKGGTQ